MAGAHQTIHSDGVSILPALKNNITQQKQHEFLYWEFHENNGRQAVRMGKWKGIKLNVSINDNSPIELYDLEKDPYEKNNIAAQHPDIVSKIAILIQREHVENKDWPLLKSEIANSSQKQIND